MPDDTATTYRAAWVAPMAGPVIHDGTVTVAAGRVAAVGPSAGGGTDLGDVVLLPGLVNAHVHLELSRLSPGDPPASFVAWLARLMATAGLPSAAAAADGAAECLRFGVTAVGDVTAAPATVRPAVAASGLAGVSYGEVRGMAQRRGLLDARLAAAADPIAAGRLVAGVSPHAPYSVEVDGYRRCLAVAQERGLPVCTHLAETPDEAVFLAEHAGPFRDLWATLAAWSDDVPRFAGGPVRLARDLGLLDDRRTLLAHANELADDEVAILAAGRASVAYCPRTHAYFGRPPHRWRELLAAGVNVAVGTDSRASAPDLNVVDDLRLLRRLAPDVPAVELWAMATTRAAVAINRPDLGSLTVGSAADLVAFPVSASSRDPLADVLDGTAVPCGVWAAGAPLRDGATTRSQMQDDPV